MIKKCCIRALKTVKILIIMALIGLISGELILQGLSFVVRASGHSMQKQWLTTNTRVLTLGDSFVYGLFLPQNLSWPAQLQQQWNTNLVDGQQPIEVLNLGFPGTNSARVLANIDEFMKLFHPDIVLIMVGANDVWTPKESVGKKDNLWLETVGWIRQNSRLYKLWYMAKKEAFDSSELEKVEPWPNMENYTQKEALEYFKQRLEQTKEFDEKNEKPMRYGEHEFIMQFTDGGPGRDLDNLGNRLLQIQQIIRSYGAKVMFVSYPTHGGYYIHASIRMQKMQKKGDIELIDVSQHFSDCPTIESCPDLLFADGHPKSKGYRRIADFIRVQLPKYLP